MTELSKENDLIKQVFATDQGRELLDVWNESFTKRSSFQHDNTPEQTAYNEGTRMFYQTIQNIFDNEVK